MDRLLTRVNDIADSDRTSGEKALAYTVAIFDTEIAKLIRTGPDPLKALRGAGFVDIADLLNEMTGPGRCGDIAPTLALLANSTQPTCALTAGHAGWHRGDDGSEWIERTDKTPR